MNRQMTISTFRKLHKWPGIIIAFFAFHFAFSGIIMNHRDLLSGIDVSRKWLPGSYSYLDWNMAAVRGGISLNKDSVIIFGNIGTWIKTGNQYIDFNSGFPNGIDNRKINQLIIYNHQLIAATQFGLYRHDLQKGDWIYIPVPVEEQRLIDLFVKQDTLMILSRNNLIKTKDLQNFKAVNLPVPNGYTKSAGVFTTLWQLHSGELFGFVGKLIVDLLGLVTIVLSVTGLLHFFLPKVIRRRKKKTGTAGNLPKNFRSNLKWHNLVGYVFVLFLFINTLAGSFLRPPLMIPIINSKVCIIPGSHLDNDNPWYDQLRKGTYNERSHMYIFSTSQGFYVADENLSSPMIPFGAQPPVSLMGCNVLVPVDASRYLVGSFSGMFIWDFQSGDVIDFFSGQNYVAPAGMAMPVADHMVAGYIKDAQNRSWVFDYNFGIMAINHPDNWVMPQEVKIQSPISLWNLALEVHTGRIFEPFIGMLYLLYVPIAGICVLMVLVSGFFVWWLGHRKKQKLVPHGNGLT